MRSDGGEQSGEAPGGGGREIARPDPSPAAVNQRLAAFITEHKTGLAKGDPRALRESDQLLAAWAADVLEYQNEAGRLKAEAQAKIERMEFDRRGGRLQ